MADNDDATAVHQAKLRSAAWHHTLTVTTMSNSASIIMEDVPCRQDARGDPSSMTCSRTTGMRSRTWPPHETPSENLRVSAWHGISSPSLVVMGFHLHAAREVLIVHCCNTLAARAPAGKLYGRQDKAGTQDIHHAHASHAT